MIIFAAQGARGPGASLIDLLLTRRPSLVPSRPSSPRRQFTVSDQLRTGVGAAAGTTGPDEHGTARRRSAYAEIVTTGSARARRSAVAILCAAPLLVSSACGSAEGSESAAASAATPGAASSAPAPKSTALDPVRTARIDAGLAAVSSDRVLMDAATRLRSDAERMRAAGALAPATAKTLNDLRVARPKNCAAVRPAVARADVILRDGRSGLTATTADVSAVSAAVTRLRPTLVQVRVDIAALQSAADLNSDGRQRLTTYADAAQGAEVNLTGTQTDADEAATRASRLSTTFSRLESARDKAAQGC